MNKKMFHLTSTVCMSLYSNRYRSYSHPFHFYLNSGAVSVNDVDRYRFCCISLMEGTLSHRWSFPPLIQILLRCTIIRLQNTACLHKLKPLKSTKIKFNFFSVYTLLLYILLTFGITFYNIKYFARFFIPILT